MIIFILIVFAFATIRTIVPLAKPEHWDVPSISFAVIHVIAYVYLCSYFLTFKTTF